MQDNLYVIRPEIGNQCSDLRSGLLCSCREDLRINLADAFWIFWSLCRRHSGTPARRQLPQSKRDRTRDTTRVWLHPLSSNV